MVKGMMKFFRGSSKNDWHPVKGIDTTTSNYWINWRALVCCTWILTAIAMAAYVIQKYELGPNKQRSSSSRGDDQRHDDNNGMVVYEEDLWKPCLKGIHLVWLMAFRVFAFFVLLFIILLNAIIYGDVFYFYTEWTFTLLTIYFFLFGSLLSIYGCYRSHVGQEDQRPRRQVAGFWCYMFQIIFQMVAGAVVITDCLFWFIIVPYLARKNNNRLNFLTVNLHSINLVFLLGDAALNSLRFPWFRIAYFVLWTCAFVVFEWILHACIFTWWPYPFLDLSYSLSPLWYLLVALLHFPCYGVFFLAIKLKRFLLMKWFPSSNS